MSVSKIAQAARSLPAYADTAGRAVHIKIHPQPRNLAESIEVLRVLQRYGEVVMYKHLKREPERQAANTALAIYQNTSSAQKVIDASPLRFDLERPGAGSLSSVNLGSMQAPSAGKKDEEPRFNGEQPEPDDSYKRQEWLKSLATGESLAREPLVGETSSTGPNARNRGHNSGYSQANSIPISSQQKPQAFTPNPNPSRASTTSLPYPPSPSSTSANTPKTETTEFNLTVVRSVLNHQAYIQRQHYYSGFRLDDRNIMAEDLEARVPVKGLVDCQMDKGESPLRTRLRKENARKERRRTLGELWREAQQKREGREEKDIRMRVSSSDDDTPTITASNGVLD